jgi:acyl-CoA synthetase (NDP forming)
MLTTSESGRLLYGQKELKTLLAPKSVVIVGASERPGSFGGQVLLNALGSPGLEISVVNPRAERIHGIQSVTSLAELNHPIDLVAICLPRASVLSVAREARSLGIPNAVVYSSGFAETGEADGMAAQEELVDISLQGLRILGPNSLGFINFHKGTELEFVPAYGAALQAGSIGIIAQSGALGYLLTQAQHRGVGFSYWAAAGNSCDVDSLDLANYMLEDPNTQCVVLVLESVKDGARVFEIGRRSAELGKPVIIYKMGDSEHGGRAAQSHTGALTGSAVVTRQVFVDAGFVVVDHFDEIIGTANLFAKYGRARGKGVGLISSSGGAAIISADEAELSGVSLPSLSVQTVSALEELLPAFASATNPADLTAEMVKNVPALEKCLRVFRQDENLALIMMSLTAASPAITGARAPVIARIAAEPGGAPIGIIWFSEWLDGPGAHELESHPNIVMFRSARVALRAIRRWVDWSAAVYQSSGGAYTHGSDAQTRTAAAYLDSCLKQLQHIGAAAGLINLDEVEGKQVLKLLGVRTSEPVIIDPENFMASWDALASLSYPAVVKILDRAVLHKARIGGVHLHVRSPQEALGSAIEMSRRLGSAAASARTIVESMVSSRGEWFLGARRDSAFGVVVTIGIGGGDVESHLPLLIVGTPSPDEISRRLCEATGDIGTAIAREPQIRDQLTAAAVKLIQLFIAVPALSEVDVNPLMVTAEGLVAVDAVMIAAPCPI